MLGNRWVFSPARRWLMLLSVSRQVCSSLVACITYRQKIAFTHCQMNYLTCTKISRYLQKNHIFSKAAIQISIAARIWNEIQSSAQPPHPAQVVVGEPKIHGPSVWLALSQCMDQGCQSPPKERWNFGQLELKLEIFKGALHSSNSAHISTIRTEIYALTSERKHTKQIEFSTSELFCQEIQVLKTGDTKIQLGGREGTRPEKLLFLRRQHNDFHHLRDGDRKKSLL